MVGRLKRVLVIGSGGREHAIAWKLAQSPLVGRLYVTPGNDGMGAALQEQCTKSGIRFERWTNSLPSPLSTTSTSFQELAERAAHSKVDMAVVGPDNPLADGIVDMLEARGILTFGPSKKAAQLEASKSFAKEVMRAAGVPTAEYKIANTLEEAKEFFKKNPWGSGWVIKADGLALGKGVRVCDSQEDALMAVDELFPVSRRLVIEQRLEGEELSWMALCDGKNFSLLEPARDYKRVGTGNLGPNTGGMGSYAPVAEFLNEEFKNRVREHVFAPVLEEMIKRGSPFKGCLYAGLMYNRATKGLWVIEFNARFGDPEAQVLLPRVKGDLYPWLEKASSGRLGDAARDIPFESKTSVIVIAAAEGYPEAPKKGDEISGPLLSAPKVFLAGVQKGSGAQPPFLTAGGRVLGVVGVGENLTEARKDAYQNIEQIKFNGMHFRGDIGE